MRKAFFTTATVLLLCVYMVFCMVSCDSNKEELDTASLLEQVTEINTSIDALKTADTAIGSYIDVLETSVANTEAELTAINAKIKALEDDVTIDSSIDTLKSELNTLKTTTENEIAALKNVITGLKAKETEFERKIAVLEANVATLASKEWASATFVNMEQYFSIQNAINSIKGDIESINATFNTLEISNKFDAIQNALNTVDGKIEVINSTLATIQTNINENKSNIEDLLKRLEEFEKKNAKLEMQLNCLMDNHIDVDVIDGKCDGCGSYVEHSHIDVNNDNKCDICSAVIDEVYGPLPWADEDPIKIIFQMTHNDHNKNMPSGCLRYLAGEDQNARDSIDDEVLARNINAELYTNVDVTYNYYENVSKYDWGKCIEIMESNVKSGARDMPDIYCNFAYDMIGTSLKGTFANLKNTELDQGNYFQFLDEDYNESVDNRGYMFEYMKSVTLSQEKMYVLASDYFIDLIRAFYVVPVNIQLLESVGMQVTGDLDGNQKFDIDDFYEEVWQKKWTYDKLAAYSATVYRNVGQSSDSEDIEDILGFAVTHGYCGSAFIYCSQIKIIEKKWDDAKGDYNYEYPTDSPQLYELFSNVKTLVTSRGVYDVPQPENNEIVAKYGSSNSIAIRTRFCDNKILFGGIILVAALENTPYQTLRDQGGFGIVPVPLYHEVSMESSESYLTAIHNTARPGGIARNTKNFSACTAFLDYQSTHSTHILNEYYDYKLQYGLTDGRTGTVEMLQYIRYNVRSAFEKSFEDAIGVYFSVKDDKWSYILEKSDFEKGDAIRTDYGELRKLKQGYLDTLYREYEKLP